MIQIQSEALAQAQRERGENSLYPVGSGGAATSGASSPFFHMQPPIACCESAGRAEGLLSLLIPCLLQSSGPSV